MSRVRFADLMEMAERGKYAVGYFESWNMESLLAVADAAERLKSPVILGFSGIYLPHPDRAFRDPLSDYAVLGTEVCERLAVPACLLFNESPDLEWVFEAVGSGFDLVMYTDENNSPEEQAKRTAELVRRAHGSGAAVEGELVPLAGASGGVVEDPGDAAREEVLTNLEQALNFAGNTGVDALAVDVGQIHLHVRRKLDLDIDHLENLRDALDLPLVLHGASSVSEKSLQAAIAAGIRKINVGSTLKRTYFERLKDACNTVAPDYIPYDVVGSLNRGDVNVEARRALQRKVEELMVLFGSAGKA
jgi:fructose/tagatose bisphosphate aldolase